MLKIKNVEIYGLERAVNVAGYPMQIGEPKHFREEIQNWERFKKLGSAASGSGHDVSLSGVIVQCDIKFPLYWLKQFQRYHFFQINSSQSTMHRITKMNIAESCNKYVNKDIIDFINILVNDYYECKDKNKKHKLFMQIISNLPSGFEMWMGITTNYLQLKTIYQQRRKHKLEDWQIFCDWIETLPKFKELCIKEKK